MWGRSLLPALDGELEERNAPLDLRLYREDDPMRGMRGSHAKLVADNKSQAVVQYFDLASDPHELEPQSLFTNDPRGSNPKAWPSNPSLALPDEEEMEFSKRANELWKDLATCAEALGVGDSGEEMPEDLLRRLNDLGYTGKSKDQ